MRIRYSFFGPLLFLTSVACGGGAAKPTAIPASLVRPAQSTPVYANRVGAFSQATPVNPPIFAEATPPTMPQQPNTAAPVTPIRRALPMRQTPTALGILRSAAALLVQPDGATVQTLPAGATLTITGKSADGRFYAAYTNAGKAGWVSASVLGLFGDDDLLVVDEVIDPAPFATLIAAAMQPVVLPTSPPPTRVGATPATDPVRMGTVIGQSRLNVRAAPAVTAALVAKLNPGDTVTLLGQTADSAWWRVRLSNGLEGWVAAQYLRILL